MMAAAAFDTHAFIKRLESAGMDVRQAEAVSDAVGSIVLDTVAAKADVLATAQDLRLEMREMEQRLTIRMGAMTAATITILGAMIAFHR